MNQPISNGWAPAPSLNQTTSSFAEILLGAIATQMRWNSEARARLTREHAIMQGLATRLRLGESPQVIRAELRAQGIGVAEELALPGGQNER